MTPGNLREIAHHIDELRSIILPSWEAAAANNPHAAEVVASLRSPAMQDDLRALADQWEMDQWEMAA